MIKMLNALYETAATVLTSRKIETEKRRGGCAPLGGKTCVAFLFESPTRFEHLKWVRVGQNVKRPDWEQKCETVDGTRNRDGPRKISITMIKQNNNWKQENRDTGEAPLLSANPTANCNWHSRHFNNKCRHLTNNKCRHLTLTWQQVESVDCQQQMSTMSTFDVESVDCQQQMSTSTSKIKTEKEISLRRPKNAL